MLLHCNVPSTHWTCGIKMLLQKKQCHHCHQFTFFWTNVATELVLSKMPWHNQKCPYTKKNAMAQRQMQSAMP